MRRHRPLRAPASWLRLPRRTARMRLTLLYGGLFLISGAAMLGTANVLVHHDTGNSFFFTAPSGRNEIQFNTSQSPRPHRSALPHIVRQTPGVSRPARESQAQARSQLRQDESYARRQHAEDLNQLIIASGITLSIMTALSLALGWFVAGRVLSPVRTITRAAQVISASNLHRRLALDGPDDEFKRLGDTLDDLFGRLDAAFEAQRHFVANASHELRTPLALERTLLQVALADPDAPASALRATCQELLEAGEREQRLIEALLTLATSERGLDRREPADLSEAAGEALLTARSPIEGQGLRIRTALSPAPVIGDPDLVTRLAANLVDNAVRYNVPGGRVEIGTGTRDGHAVLSVVNTGPAIAPEQVTRLFQPFQRMRTARTGNGGHGLGLSIVTAIAAAHQAGVTARARPEGGLDIEVSFPAAPAEPAGAASARRAVPVA